MANLQEIDRVTNQIHSIQQTYGLITTILIVIAAATLYLTWRHLIRKSEVLAERSSEKYLKKIQTEFDKEVVKFQATHTKQVDAIHETFQKTPIN